MAILAGDQAIATKLGTPSR